MKTDSYSNTLTYKICYKMHISYLGINYNAKSNGNQIQQINMKVNEHNKPNMTFPIFPDFITVVNEFWPTYRHQLPQPNIISSI